MAALSLATLQQVALNAEDVGEQLSRFKGQVPEAKTEMMGIVAGIYGFCSEMNHFDTAVKEYRLVVVDKNILASLDQILRDSTTTLSELSRLLKKMQVASGLKELTMISAWKEIVYILKEQESTLQTRLESYKEGMSLLLATLHTAVNRTSRPIHSRMDSYDSRRFAEDIYRSPTAPPTYGQHTSPKSPLTPAPIGLSPTSPTRRGRRDSFSQRFQETNFFDDNFQRQLPSNPHFPLPHRRKNSFLPLMDTEFVQYVDPHAEASSEGSNSSQTSKDIYQQYFHQAPTPKTNSQSRRKSQPNLQRLNLNIQVDDAPVRRRGSAGKPEHWASRVYGGTVAETKFKTDTVLLSSQCSGKNMMVVRQTTAEEELLKLKFASDFLARIWRDESTGRVRIVCQIGRKDSPDRFRSAIDLAYLTICRNGAALELQLRDSLWAVLSFANMEDLVIFHSTFLVLRQLGRGPPALNDAEIFLDEEDLLYSGFISDDEGGEHFFRVFRDQNSGAVRIAAFIKGGDMHDLPVWTAFIRDHVNMKGWLTRTAAKVRLGMINLISFSDMYDTKAYKDWELRFTEREDAKNFERVLKIDLRSRGR